MERGIRGRVRRVSLLWWRGREMMRLGVLLGWRGCMSGRTESAAVEKRKRLRISEFDGTIFYTKGS